MPLDLDLASNSAVRQALRRFRRDEDAALRTSDRRLLWQERLRQYVGAEDEAEGSEPQPPATPPLTAG